MLYTQGILPHTCIYMYNSHIKMICLLIYNCGIIWYNKKALSYNRIILYVLHVITFDDKNFCSFGKKNDVGLVFGANVALSVIVKGKYILCSHQYLLNTNFHGYSCGVDPWN